MGCHTWCYRKSNRSIESARKIAISELEITIHINNSILADPNYENLDWSEFSIADLQHSTAVNERKIRMIKAGLCNIAVMNLQPDISIYVPGKGLYISDDELPHDIFRVVNYPEVKLFSLGESNKFINDPNNNCTINEMTIPKLEKFWNDHPDGMIGF